MHGNVNYFQCEHGYVFSNKDYELKNDHLPDLVGDIPMCQCEYPVDVRPNILLKNDTKFNTKPYDQ